MREQTPEHVNKLLTNKTYTNMEQEPNPELPPLKDNCMHCDKDYYLTPDNAVLNMFINDPICNYLETTCDHCNENTRIILSGLETVKECKKRGIPVEVARFADTDMRQTYMDLNEMPLIEAHELTPHQENVALFAAYLLLKEYIAVDNFNEEGEIII